MREREEREGCVRGRGVCERERGVREREGLERGVCV